MANSEEAKMLAIFEAELPDPEAILYLQKLPEFETFTCFLKLPIEIRLMIFKATFEPRRVKLGIAMITPPPIVLLLNKESRPEGLKHYIPIVNNWDDGAQTIGPHKYKPRLGPSERWDAIVYLNPKIDTLVVFIETLDLISLDVEEFLGTSLAGIRNLEMRHGLLGLMSDLADSDTTSLEWNLAFDCLRDEFSWIMVAGYFRDLEELRLGLLGGKIYREAKKRMEKVLTDCFTAATAWFPDAKIPRMTWIGRLD